MFETKIHRSNNTFSRLVLIEEQRTDKSLGRYTLENFFSTDLHELEKQPKTKVEGQLAPLGGTTGYKLRALPDPTGVAYCFPPNLSLHL